MTALKGYAASIATATGYTDPDVVAEIEQAMRDQVRTLDHLDRRAFDRLARESVVAAVATGIIVICDWTASLAKAA